MRWVLTRKTFDYCLFQFNSVTFPKWILGASYRNISYLRAHELSDCGHLPIYECDECGKSFANSFSLKNHKTSHTDDEKKFRNPAHLKRHNQTHTGERPLQCHHCKKFFAGVEYMKAHMALHVGGQRYRCYGCGGRFITNSALHKHRKYRKDTCALAPIKPPLYNGE